MKQLGRWLILTVLFALPHGVQAQGRCEPIEVRTLLEEAERGRDHLLNFEPEAALETLNHALEQVLCVTSVPSPQLLANAYLWLGVARRFNGDREGASSAFEAALAILPDLPWNRVFGKMGHTEFEEARSRILCDACACLSLPALRIEGQLYLDGQAISPEKRKVATMPGQHLLQVVVQGDVLWSQLVVAHAEAPDLSLLGQLAQSETAVSGWFAPSVFVQGDLAPGWAVSGALGLTAGWYVRGEVSGNLSAANRWTRADVVPWGFELAIVYRRQTGIIRPWLGLGGGHLWFPNEGLTMLSSSGGVQVELGARWLLGWSARAAWTGEPDGTPWRLSTGIELGFLLSPREGRGDF